MGESNRPGNIYITMGRRGADSARAFHVYFSTEGDSVDYPQYSVYDAGEMPAEVMITATCEFGDGDGTLCMFGGNNYDSWQAGYMVYKAADQVWFCVQMNANGSDPHHVRVRRLERCPRCHRPVPQRLRHSLD